MARKGKRLGSVAAEVVAYGDLDAAVAADIHYEMLAAHEALELHATREANERFVGKLRLRRTELAEHLAARARHRSEAEAEAADRIAVVQRWRDAGIRERMTIRTIPRSAKWALWALIAALDFYIFAQVVAYAENIPDPGLGDATFWLGGAVGITVFIVGILLGQALRRASLFYAQKQLLREISQAGEDTTGLRLSHYSRWMTLSFAVFYVALTAGAVVLRYQGGGKAQPGLLLLQTMIPVIGVMLELLIDDPTEVRLPQRGLADWWLQRRIRRLDARISLRQLVTSEHGAAVADRYRFERAALAALHRSQGVTDSWVPDAPAPSPVHPTAPEPSPTPYPAPEPEPQPQPQTYPTPQPYPEPEPQPEPQPVASVAATGDPHATGALPPLTPAPAPPPYPGAAPTGAGPA